MITNDSVLIKFFKWWSSLLIVYGFCYCSSHHYLSYQVYFIYHGYLILSCRCLSFARCFDVKPEIQWAACLPFPVPFPGPLGPSAPSLMTLGYLGKYSIGDTWPIGRTARCPLMGRGESLDPSGKWRNIHTMCFHLRILFPTRTMTLIPSMKPSQKAESEDQLPAVIKLPCKQTFMFLHGCLHGSFVTNSIREAHQKTANHRMQRSAKHREPS